MVVGPLIAQEAIHGGGEWDDIGWETRNDTNRPRIIVALDIRQLWHWRHAHAHQLRRGPGIGGWRRRQGGKRLRGHAWVGARRVGGVRTIIGDHR